MYEGYLKPYLPMIRDLSNAGKSTSQIAETLTNQGVISPYGVVPSASLIHYALGWKPKKSARNKIKWCFYQSWTPEKQFREIEERG